MQNDFNYNSKPMDPKNFLITAILIAGMVIPPCVPDCAGQQVTADTNSASFRIIKAVEKGDAKTVTELLAADPALVNTREPGIDDPLLVWAARNNQPAVVALLLNSGADIGATNRLGSNVLHLAAFTGDYDMMELLMKSGADWNLRNLRGKIPIDYVSYGKNPRVFDLFLAKDKNLLQERTTDGSTLLHLAAVAGDTAGFSYLLGLGLDIRATDNLGRSVVHHAMEGGNLSMLTYLRRCNADLDAAEKEGFTPLYWAVLTSNREAAQFLLSNGADLNHHTREGQTPLMMAVMRNSLPMVEMLCGQGADLLAEDNEGKTALHLAAIEGNLPVISYLIQRRIPVNARDKQGKTALHYASIYGYAEPGRVLIENGADPSVADNSGHDAFFYSEWYGNKVLCQYLQQKEGRRPGSGVPPKPVETGLAHSQAVVHYLNHSGYAIETEKHLLVFDYFQPGASPTTPSLLNGRINPGELKEKKMIVFVSHEHGDHYDTAIWRWRKADPGITYVMGFKPATEESYNYVAPRGDTTIEGVRIHAIRSTDSGVGFLTETDGIVVYHPGDHVNKTRVPGEDFKGEIDYLAGLKMEVDIAFFPVAGCGFPDREAVRTGNYYVISEMKPGICISMHGETAACEQFSCDISRTFSSQQTSFGTYPGDRFLYTKPSSRKPG